MFNFLLISFIIFIIISILFLISFYLFIKESKKKNSGKICKSNKDCNNAEICTLDIDYQNRCFKKNDIFHIFYTKLLVND